MPAEQTPPRVIRPAPPLELDALFRRLDAERGRQSQLRAAWQANAARIAHVIGSRHQIAPFVPADVIALTALMGLDDEAFGSIAEASGQAAMAKGGLIEKAQQSDVDKLLAFADPFGKFMETRTPEQQAATADRVAELQAAGVHPPDGDRGLWGDVMSPIRGATRAVTGALQTGYEATQNIAVGRIRGIGDLGGALLEGDLGGAVGAAGAAFGYQGLMPSTWQATTGGQAVSQLVDTGEINAGSGFFAAGTVAEQQAQRARETRGTDPNGHAWTLGRLVASTVFEPGSKPYGYASGAVDFAMALGLDPANYVLPGSGALRARRAAAVVPAGEARALGAAEDALSEAGRLSGVAEEAAKAGDLTSFDAVSGLAAGRTADAAQTVAGVELRTGVTRAARRADPEWRATVEHAAGIIDTGTYGVRRAVLAPRAMKWLYSTDGQRVVARVTEMTSPSEIMAAHGDKIDVGGAVALAHASTPEDVVRIYGHAFAGGTVRELPTAGHWSGNVGPLRMRVMNKARDQWRIAGLVPEGTYLDPDDPEAAYRVLRDTLGNVGILGDERRALVDGWMQAKATGQPGDMFQAIGDVSSAVRTQLVDAGMAEDAARAMTDWKRGYGRFTEYLVDDLGNGLDFDFLGGGKGPTRVVELLSSGQWIHDPDAVRELRAVTSRLAKVPGFKAASWSASQVAHWQSKLWKPLVLLRPAYLTRVNGEEVVRTLFGGRFRHASDWLMAIVGHGYGTDLAGDTFDLGKRLRKLDDEIVTAQNAGHNVDNLVAEQQRVADRITDHYGDPYVNALAGRVKGKAAGIALRDDDMAEYMVRTGNWVKVDKRTHPREWTSGQLDELAKLRRDPIARRIAHGGPLPGDGDGLRAGLDGIEDWLLHGDGRSVADRMAAAYPDVDRGHLVREWIDLGVRDVQWRTGLNDDLLDVIADGQFRGQGAFTADGVSPELRRFLNEWRDTDEAPQWVKFEQQMTAGQEAQRNALVSWFFGTLYGKSSDYLARSPTFRSAYWERVSELAGSLSPDEARKALAKLDKAKLPNALRDKVRGRLATARGESTIADVDLIAKGYGLDEANKLLMDASRKSQFFDVYRALFPFGEAWKEILTTWTRIGTENPRVLNAARKVIVAGRSADPDQDGQGFLYAGADGNEVFNFPVVGRAAEALSGVNVELPVRLKDMSLSTTIMPGIGPIASFPIAAIIPDRPEFEDVAALLFPFGSPEDRQVDPVQALLPVSTWAQKLGAAVPGVRDWFGFDNPQRNVVYGNTLMETYSALAASGDYNLRDPAELDRLAKDAKEGARWISALRGVVQATGPASPSLVYTVETLDGDITVAKLAEDFRSMQATDYDTAVERFIAKYGANAHIYMASKSTITNPGLQATDEFSVFERDHPGLFDKYPAIASYFGPAGGEFSFDVYNRQRRQGRREAQTPNERLADANDLLGRMIFDNAKSQLPPNPTPEQEAWLASVKDELRDDYPGFGVVTEMKLPKQLQQLEAASNDPEIQNLPAGEALVVYLARRDEVIALQQSEGVSTSTKVTTAAGGRVWRDWLRDVGADLAADYEGFDRIWRDILSRELPIEEAVEVAA